MRLEDIVRFLDSEYKTLLEMIIIEYEKRVVYITWSWCLHLLGRRKRMRIKQ